MAIKTIVRKILCLLGFHDWMYYERIAYGQTHARENRMCRECKLQQELGKITVRDWE